MQCPVSIKVGLKYPNTNIRIPFCAQFSLTMYSYTVLVIEFQMNLEINIKNCIH